MNMTYEESINYLKEHSGNDKWKWFINYHSDSLFIFDKIEYVLEIISNSKRINQWVIPINI